MLIDQLLEIFGPVSSKADEIVGQAKVLWQQKQQSDALDLLCEHMQTHSSQVSEALPTLRQLKDLVGGQVGAQDNEILQLKLHAKKQDQHMRRQDTRLEVLEKKVTKAEGAYEKRQQRGLLGHAAYALAKIIEQYIYGPAGFPYGLAHNLEQDA